MSSNNQMLKVKCFLTIVIRVRLSGMHRYVIGDQTILKSAGVSSSADIESLPAPAELAGVVNVTRLPGEIDYLICTRAGKGAHVLEDQSVSLLDPVSGLPSQKRQ